MRIIVDADACPVKDIIEQVAKSNQIPVIMISNINHIISSTYSEVVIVDDNPEAADYAIVNRTSANDIVITQDYGLASMVLGKNAKAINPNGKIYTLDNIDTLLMQRHINFKARSAGLKVAHSKKRKKSDDKRFKNNLEKLID
ncbi:MAG TPA: YaiI/YqxD family protein [Syntrophomonadaceae bacterium]|nr:YaiI/YqxD family protein [Syntrophomonadaceae bacterium]